jgi:hypothetical protein
VVCVPDEPDSPGTQERVVVREERQSFNNQPLKGLADLKLM